MQTFANSVFLRRMFYVRHKKISNIDSSFLHNFFFIKVYWYKLRVAVRVFPLAQEEITLLMLKREGGGRVTTL